MTALDAQEISLTIGELAAMVGVSTDTIRAWERRHRVLSPERTVTRHRRYGMDDVETLRRVRHNVGVRGLSLKLAIAEARGDLVVGTAPIVEPPLAESGSGDGDQAPWRAVADLLPNVVCILDSAGRIVDTNMAFALLAGVLRMQLRGMRILDLVEPADRAKAARLYRPRPQRHRGWELNLRTCMFSGLFTFDLYVVTTMTGAWIVLIGRDLSSSGLELWPQLETAPGEQT